MAKRRANRNNKQRKNRGDAFSCPLCDAQAIPVQIDKVHADLMFLQPGIKYVCSGKFIYRSNTSTIQFSECYGIPIEFSIKCRQIGETKSDIIHIAKNFSSDYIQDIMNEDPFFTNVCRYVADLVKKAEPIDDDESEDEEEEIDLKEDFNNESED